MGGNIDPRPSLRLLAAHNFSENLPMVDIGDSINGLDAFLANNTHQSLDYGVVSGFLRQQVNHIKICFEQYGVESVFLTGGQSLDQPIFTKGRLGRNNCGRRPCNSGIK